MPKIYKLDKSVAKLIAAGEVVERPSSAVKELVENSIDAGAKSVAVEIKGGGTSYLRVADDGCGISREDLPTAFLRNATSKIRTAADLEKIGTLGFRGEALASISAVARLTMISRAAEEPEGCKIRLDGGEIQDIAETGCPVGTTVIVRDLFYNTPARMKFLKKDSVEANSVAACMDRLALSHPEISFKFIRDGKTQFFSPGKGDLYACIYSVFGRETAESLIEVKGEGVSGYISKPESSRGSRNMQFFFVNGRYVRSVTAQTALEEAYKNEIMQGKFPTGFLFITVPEELVDVNTHPAKIEVRFVQERDVYEAIYFAVKNALTKFSVPPAINLNHEIQKTLFKNEALKTEAVSQTGFAPPATRVTPAKRPDFFQSASAAEFVKKPAVLNQPVAEYKKHEPVLPAAAPPIESIEIPGKPETPPAKPFLEGKRLVGEIFSTYILLETADELFIIDKHAAHERIIFERLKENTGGRNSQLLLSPVHINFPKEEYALLLENSLELAEFGIMIDDFGTGTVIVREFPAALEKADIKSTLEEIAASFKKGRMKPEPKYLDELYSSIACKAAVKGGRSASREDIYSLLAQLEQNGEIRRCPHGRPVLITLSKREIEKKFGRIQ
ncbi:MAG: DNA mismatch repair endonuclease MutL [Oscillospiraceae bacterium]|jgi:DNA mismatch repair protein MutL|nr:DNA mismatch repair endonuclease MutL [Oscillospiraceae bacterium]